MANDIAAPPPLKLSKEDKTNIILAAGSVALAAIVIVAAYYVSVVSFDLTASISPQSVAIPAGKTVVLTVSPFLNGRLILDKTFTCKWSVHPSNLGTFLPTWDQNTWAVFVSNGMEGNGTIECNLTYRNSLVSTRVNVTIQRAVLDKVTITPDYAKLATGQRQQFNATAYDSTGAPISAVNYAWTVWAYPTFDLEYSLDTTYGQCVNLTVWKPIGMNLNVYADCAGIEVFAQILVEVI